MSQAILTPSPPYVNHSSSSLSCQIAILSYIEASLQSKQEDAISKERALVYAHNHQDWVCFWPMTAKLGLGAQVTVWSKPRGLVYLLYVIKSPQSSMILPADHVLRERSPSSPSSFPKPSDSIKNWFDHFFWVDAIVFPILVSLYVGGVLEKDLAPHLTARQEQTVRLLENNKALFRRYPECFLCLVGQSPYYPFDENTYPAFERPDGTDMGLLDFIKTVDPRKVQAVEVQKKDDQVKLLESTSHCFMPLVAPAAGVGSSAAAPEVSAPEVSVPAEVEPENVIPEDTYLDLMGPDEVVATARQEVMRKRWGKQGDAIPAIASRRRNHPSFSTGTGGKTLAGLRQLMPTSPPVSRPSFQADVQAHVVQSARITDVPVYTTAAIVTSALENVGITPTFGYVVGFSAETSEGADGLLL
ncbi:hypothetical protein Tco_0762288 [Tanacetum coccineum]